MKDKCPVKGSVIEALQWEHSFGGSGMYQYAMIRKMELTGVGKSLWEHNGCPVDYHIRYCMPLMGRGHAK